MDGTTIGPAGEGDATPFSVVADLLEAVVHAKKGAIKRKHLRTFFDFIGKDYFCCMRLILPELDKERGNYGLGSEKLAKCVAEALGLVKEAPDFKKLVEWRRGGTKKAGKSAGNFAMVAAEVLESRQRVRSAGLTIRAVNELLDRLVVAEKREAKNTVMAELINKTNTREMKWIIMVILKDMKLGVSEKTVFSEFHPDAEDIFNVTCDLKGLCEKLSDRSQRFKRQDIEVGRVVRPQLAARVATVEQGLKKLRGKEVVEECKFDGDRIQLHKDGAKLNFFSRSAIDHSEQYIEIFGNVLKERVLPERCILDGEMLVWNRATNRFTPFGQNRSVAKDMKDGLDRDEQLCYIAFDILYYEDHSVIHSPLRERHKILQKAVNPLPGTLEVLVPGNGINSRPGAAVWSIVPSGLDEANDFFFDMVENRDEGVIIKDLDSRWEPADRSGRWVKVKPDYINVENDLDVLIIGGYYGSGRHRGGQVAQFLLGIAERPRAGGYPSRFYTFCKVGTGYTMEELDDLRNRLNPYWRVNEKGSDPPRFYIATNSHKERPDFWIDQPEKSVILQIKSDIRTIQTDVFATKYSLRFPRVSRIRYDKPWYDCLDKEGLEEIVKAGGSMDSARYAALQETHTRHKRVKSGSAPLPLVPLHLQTTDVTAVKQHSAILAGCLFYFVSVPEGHSKDSAHRLVVEYGGKFSMNLTPAVTHVIASKAEGPRYAAAAKHGDVIHFSWLIACVDHKHRLPIRPRYYLHLSELTKEEMRDSIDRFGDSYTDKIATADLVQVLGSMPADAAVADAAEVAALEAEHSSGLKYGIFRGATFYIPPLPSIADGDSWAVAKSAMQRVRLEVSMHGGAVLDCPTPALTHVLLYAPPEGGCLNWKEALSGLKPKERKLVYKARMVGHKWVEACMEAEGRVAEEPFDLRTSVAGLVYESASDVDARESSMESGKSKGSLPSPVLSAKQTPTKRAPRQATSGSRAVPARRRAPKRKALDIIKDLDQDREKTRSEAIPSATENNHLEVAALASHQEPEGKPASRPVQVRKVAEGRGRLPSPAPVEVVDSEVRNASLEKSEPKIGTVMEGSPGRDVKRSSAPDVSAKGVDDEGLEHLQALPRPRTKVSFAERARLALGK